MHRTNFERYANYCKCIETTPLYVEFSFLNLIAACLQRRVWLGVDDWKVFPNLYLVFVGEPGTGKTNAAKVNVNILKRLVGLDSKPLIPVAPDTISVEGLIRKLSFGMKLFQDKQGIHHAQTPMTFISEELANLFKKEDQQLVKFFIQGYDCGDYSKELKGNEKTNSFESVASMCLNFLAATNPNDVRDMTAKGLLQDGFLGRAIFMAGGYPEDKKLFFTPTADQRLDLDHVEKYCRILAETVVGECKLSKEAYEYLEDWYLHKFQILNEDRKLQFYYSRKKINVEKLAIVHHFADEHESYEIQKISVEKALDSLARAEIDMHLALTSTSKNPVHQLSEKILSFLSDRKRRYPGDITKHKKRLQDLFLIFGADAEQVQIQQACQILMISKRVITTLTNGDVYYEAVK